MTSVQDTTASDTATAQLPLNFPGKWQDYFDGHETIETERGAFSLYTQNLQPDIEQAVLILVHGAGFTALTFSVFVREFIQASPDSAVVSIDLRGHASMSEDIGDITLEILCQDLVDIVNYFQTSCWTARHSIFLVGHSLGGAIVTHAARSLGDVLGVVVIDIVEEIALRALEGIPTHLRDRPKSFASLSAAALWSRLLQNPESSAISIPDQLLYDDQAKVYRWRVDLFKCREHWRGWFVGLSAAFVSLHSSRLLILAEREYLDRTLMIEAMQGRFQTAIVRNTGHAIHEDQPAELATIISSFVERNVKVANLNRVRQALR